MCSYPEKYRLMQHDYIYTHLTDNRINRPNHCLLAKGAYWDQLHASCGYNSKPYTRK